MLRYTYIALLVLTVNCVSHTSSCPDRYNNFCSSAVIRIQGVTVFALCVRNTSIRRANSGDQTQPETVSLSLFLLAQVTTADLRTEHRPMRMVISGFRLGIKQIWVVLGLSSAKNVVSYRICGTTCPSHIKGQAWTLNMGPIWTLKVGWTGCSETTVMTYHFALFRKIPKERRPQMKLARMTRSPELWSPGFIPEGQEYNRQTVTDSGTGATVASAAPVASISTWTQLRYGYHLWQIQISLKLQTAREKWKPVRGREGDKK